MRHICNPVYNAPVSTAESKSVDRKKSAAAIGSALLLRRELAAAETDCRFCAPYDKIAQTKVVKQLNEFTVARFV